MRVQDLGALVVEVDDQPQTLSGRRSPAMLALLTINVNQRVSTDALMYAAWGEQVGPGATSTLESHIWRLRQLLEPGRSRRQPPTVLVSDAGGFRLIGGPASIDSLAFADAAVEIDNLLAAGDPAAVIRRAETALDWWRGRPYGPFADEEWAMAAVARLDELHALMLERRAEALLANGAVDVALTELQPLIAAMPFREHLRELRMEALYRAGRSEEALQAYQDTRQVLIEEVGIEPGFSLQDLHRRILINDSSLTRPARIVVASAPDPAMNLPLALTPLVGRDEVLTVLRSLLPEQRLLTITGPAGCGKTRVAAELARASVPEFRDGVWFVDLTAVADSALVAELVASTIGLAPSPSATPLEALRTYLQSRRMLLVLDNCEHVLPAVALLVRMTLGASGPMPECRFLTTSREPLSLDREMVWTLQPLALPADDPGSDPREAPAVDLFLQRMHSVAPAVRVDKSVLRRVVDICVAVDGLPLPLELAAARAASFTLDDIAEQVAADPTRLSRVGSGPSDHRRTVGAAIEWSSQLLTPDLQVAHRRLSVLPGAFTVDMAAAVLDDDGAEDPLAQLVHRSMLVSNVTQQEPDQSTTFRQLATVRSHAQHALALAGESETCHDARDRWTETLLGSRPPLGSSAEIAWYRRIDDNSASVRATLARLLSERADPRGGRLPARLSFYWYYREQLVEGTRWLRLGHDALVGPNSIDLLRAQTSVAAALATQGRLDLARPYIDEVLQPLPKATPEQMVEIGEGLVGLSTAVWPRDDYPLIIDLHRQLDRVAERAGSANLRLLADAIACHAAFVQGHVEDSIAQAEAVQERAVRQDNLMASWLVAGPPLIAAMISGKPADGIRWVNRCLQDHLRFGTGASGMFIENRANFAAMEGDYLRAAALYAAARAETRRAGMPWPRRPLTHTLIAATQNDLSRADYKRAWQNGEQLSVTQIASMS